MTGDDDANHLKVVVNSKSNGFPPRNQGVSQHEVLKSYQLGAKVTSQNRDQQTNFQIDKSINVNQTDQIKSKDHCAYSFDQAVQTSGKRLHSEAFDEDQEDEEVADLQPPTTRSTKIVLNIGQLTKAINKTNQEQYDEELDDEEDEDLLDDDAEQSSDQLANNQLPYTQTNTNQLQQPITNNVKIPHKNDQQQVLQNSCLVNASDNQSMLSIKVQQEANCVVATNGQQDKSKQSQKVTVQNNKFCKANNINSQQTMPRHQQIGTSSNKNHQQSSTNHVAPTNVSSNRTIVNEKTTSPANAYKSIYSEVLKHAVRDAWNFNSELSYQRQQNRNQQAVENLKNYNDRLQLAQNHNSFLYCSYEAGNPFITTLNNIVTPSERRQMGGSARANQNANQSTRQQLNTNNKSVTKTFMPTDQMFGGVSQHHARTLAPQSLQPSNSMTTLNQSNQKHHISQEFLVPQNSANSSQQLLQQDNNLISNMVSDNSHKPQNPSNQHKFQSQSGHVQDNQKSFTQNQTHDSSQQQQTIAAWLPSSRNKLQQYGSGSQTNNQGAGGTSNGGTSGMVSQAQNMSRQLQNIESVQNNPNSHHTINNDESGIQQKQDIQQMGVSVGNKLNQSDVNGQKISNNQGGVQQTNSQSSSQTNPINNGSMGTTLSSQTNRHQQQHQSLSGPQQQSNVQGQSQSQQANQQSVNDQNQTNQQQTNQQQQQQQQQQQAAAEFRCVICKRGPPHTRKYAKNQCQTCYKKVKKMQRVGEEYHHHQNQGVFQPHHQMAQQNNPDQMFYAQHHQFNHMPNGIFDGPALGNGGMHGSANGHHTHQNAFFALQGPPNGQAFHHNNVQPSHMAPPQNPSVHHQQHNGTTRL